MRRKEREVVDKQEIIDILPRCNTVRIAINGDKYPYAVPVSFGMEVKDDKPVIYFHCAPVGMKVDMLRANPNVCVEGDIFIRIEPTAHGITARYESVIGFGKCSFVEDMDEVIHGLKLICDHYGYQDFPLTRCKGLDRLIIGKIVLDEIYGKKNLPDEQKNTDTTEK